MIKYVIGDATCPVGDGIKIITHVSNCNNGWGRGFVLAINKKWALPEKAFRYLFTDFLPKERWTDYLGYVQMVKVEKDLYVANMIAQKGYGKNNLQKHRTSEADSETPLQMDALEECLIKVSEKASELGASIHAPRFGAGLSGGSWPDIEKLIEKHWSHLEVTIYDLS